MNKNKKLSITDRHLTKKSKKDISKEPAMIRLKELFNSEMSKEQQARTLEYLNTKGDLHNG